MLASAICPKINMLEFGKTFLIKTSDFLMNRGILEIGIEISCFIDFLSFLSKTQPISSFPNIIILFKVLRFNSIKNILLFKIFQYKFYLFFDINIF